MLKHVLLFTAKVLKKNNMTRKPRFFRMIVYINLPFLVFLAFYACTNGNSRTLLVLSNVCARRVQRPTNLFGRAMPSRRQRCIYMKQKQWRKQEKGWPESLVILSLLNRLRNNRKERLSRLLAWCL